FSNPRLPTVVPSVVSPTERPTATPSVKRLLTSGLPNSACAAAWKSTCSGCGFIVRHENHTLSVSVTVRPGWGRNFCPIVSSSKYFPATSSLPLRRSAARLDSGRVRFYQWWAMENSYDIAVIGGGIIGAATPRALGERAPRPRLGILAKEAKSPPH